MASILRPKPVNSSRFTSSAQPYSHHVSLRIRVNAKKPGSSDQSVKESSESENAVLKAAWYGSELLGIAASFFRPSPSSPESLEETVTDGGESFQVTEAIKQDFERCYFVTGNLTLRAYEEDCEFADPAGSFRGLNRFKRNCSNFGSLLEKSSMKLTKWEDLDDKSVGHWKFSCIMSFPWRPILSATGYTEYYFDAQSGRVCRHVENWNVPKMALLKQIFRPSRWVWEKK
ncbi:hypothetical protein LUZ60_016578 [Juncus effusus]|nr:hypothetical protein LUZ60_016578 [Juncus effusus]